MCLSVCLSSGGDGYLKNFFDKTASLSPAERADFLGEDEVWCKGVEDDNNEGREIASRRRRRRRRRGILNSGPVTVCACSLCIISFSPLSVCLSVCLSACVMCRRSQKHMKSVHWKETQRWVSGERGAVVMAVYVLKL